MDQNVIAVIWDFDKTLINGYMEEPIFEKYGVDSNEFWNEVSEIPEEYKAKGIRVNRDTYYLNHFLKYVKEGIFAGLNNKMLRELGRDLKFCDGLPEFLRELKDMVANDQAYKKYGIKLEHYIVSTGLTEMIRGSEIADYVDGVWGCEFLEDTNEAEENVISQIGYAVDNTSKTKAIFEINKGSNFFDNIDVNSKIPEENRRVPIKNMVYIADGPSDVPVFSVIKKNGGKTFAVYRHGNEQEFAQVDKLREDGRVDMFGETDYKKDTITYMWIVKEVKNIAGRMLREHQEEMAKNISDAPKHLT